MILLVSTAFRIPRFSLTGNEPRTDKKVPLFSLQACKLYLGLCKPCHWGSLVASATRLPLYDKVVAGNLRLHVAALTVLFSLQSYNQKRSGGAAFRPLSFGLGCSSGMTAFSSVVSCVRRCLYRLCPWPHVPVCAVLGLLARDLCVLFGAQAPR